MSLTARLEADFKKAMLAKDKERVGLLRMLKSSLKNEMIKSKQQELADEAVVKLFKSEIKKRKDSAEQYEKGDRGDLATQERKEIEIIEDYLPEQMSQDEIRQVVQQVIQDMGQAAPSQFGQVMKSVMEKISNQADGSLVSQVVKEEINKQ